MHCAYISYSYYAKYNYSAASNLKNGTSVDIGAGYGKLPSKIVNSYSWTEPVKIDRTNKRQGSKTIKVGIKTGSKGTKDFKPELVSLTLKTLEINSLLNCDSVVNEKIEDIKLTCAYGYPYISTIREFGKVSNESEFVKVQYDKGLNVKIEGDILKINHYIHVLT